MKTVTLKELAEEATGLVNAGYGRRKILIADDDECNGTHELFMLFTRLDEDSMVPLPFGVSEEEAANDYLLLG